jgi:hypothetical protein
MEQDLHDIAQRSWQHSSQRSFSHKTLFLAADLKKQRAKKPKTSYQLHTIEAQILVE